jgi:hypothetical protein
LLGALDIRKILDYFEMVGTEEGLLGSPDGAMPGTKVDGENAACSISAK